MDFHGSEVGGVVERGWPCCILVGNDDRSKVGCAKELRQK